MKNFSLIQVDDFAPDAADVRKAVVEGEFSTEMGPDGLSYTGISKYSVPQWFDLISHAIGEKITPKLAFFRINLDGELPHSWIHSDGLCAQYASLLYLNTPEQCRGGTAFWRHLGLKIDSLPTVQALTQSGVHAPWFMDMVNREWKDLTYWEQVGFIGMKWNRFITYPTSRFHSRYPFSGFGKTPPEARLTWACFYDV